MPVGGDALRVHPTLNAKQHDATAALRHRVSDCERQAAAPANDRKRTVVRQLHRGPLAPHVSFSGRARRIALVSGCEPERMKAMTSAISGSSPLLAATRSRRSLNVPAPKNIAS